MLYVFYNVIFVYMWKAGSLCNEGREKIKKKKGETNKILSSKCNESLAM